ncbi:hypothetical protein [Cellulomonas aerilata]|uniref:hypothetical protein n=1 Tax=Cellulomonas aerilata TaxID=515326 RepID=UPI0016497D34|nr:hypothetical protein [Cellulomonas aerilata]
MPSPDIPDDVHASDLDRAVRARLRTLSKDNAEQVALHLVMTGRLLDTEPELAYEHAQAAVRRAGRVDVVREAAGLAAYRTGRFAEALRELRTVRRLNGSSEHLAVMADCERGLGRPERAIALAASDEAESLEPDDQVELAMVVSGARLDLDEAEAALAVLSTGAAARVGAKDGLLAVRVAHAKATALEALGRADDAAAVLSAFSAAELAEAAGEVEEDVVVWDLADDDDPEGDGAGSGGVLSHQDDGEDGADDVDDADGSPEPGDAADVGDGEGTGVDDVDTDATADAAVAVDDVAAAEHAADADDVAATEPADHGDADRPNDTRADGAGTVDAADDSDTADTVIDGAGTVDAVDATDTDAADSNSDEHR